jgi:hypothetical protein
MELGRGVLITPREVLDRLLLAVLEDLEIVAREIGQEVRLLSETVTPRLTISVPVRKVGCPPCASARESKGRPATVATHARTAIPARNRIQGRS